ncbi:MAG: hypothetical protein KGD70_15200 [Candidatus Lokiarchaeota archaeon]|nr:hypothetical protein [Candidatus Lokiarchaeota archaeon]
MILKINIKNDQWVYFDKIDKLFVVGKHKLGENQDILQNNGELLHVDAQYLDDGWRTITEEKGKAGHKSCLVVSIKVDKNNTYDEKLIAFRGSAYLLNDEGKTIESL